MAGGACASTGPPGMPFFSKLKRHIRHGTLVEAVLLRFGVVPLQARVRWSGTEDPAEAVRTLMRSAEGFLRDSPERGWVASLGDGDAFHEALDGALRARHVGFRRVSLREALAWTTADVAGLRGIVCGYADAARLTAAARALGTSPLLSAVPFEYVAGLDPERQVFRRRDEYRDTFFVAPALLDRPTPYEIYEESLARFEQKCGLRDYLDLYQVLKYVAESRIPGDIAEFGSYKGHSGYLIARTLQALGSDKRVYLFDTFEGFPPEPYGVDHFWNRSHEVDFADVQRKLAGLPNVQLVKGDFTRTLATSGVQALALAYVDCDSYRATRYLIGALWTQHLSPRGALVCEDYGHPALLGNRAAVHEELDGRQDCFKFFSQFSGLYVAIKG